MEACGFMVLNIYKLWYKLDYTFSVQLTTVVVQACKTWDPVGVQITVVQGHAADSISEPVTPQLLLQPTVF